jgi:hypothetical protein
VPNTIRHLRPNTSHEVRRSHSAMTSASPRSGRRGTCRWPSAHEPRQCRRPRQTAPGTARGRWSPGMCALSRWPVRTGPSPPRRTRRCALSAPTRRGGASTAKQEPAATLMSSPEGWAEHWVLARAINGTCGHFTEQPEPMYVFAWDPRRLYLRAECARVQPGARPRDGAELRL